jgi:anti-sigma factor (TIGR02949 family)
MIPCSEAVQQLWEYLEDASTTPDRDAIEHHLAFCRRCCGEVAFARELRRLLAAAATVELPTDVEDRLLGGLDLVAAGEDASGTDRRHPDGRATT